MENVIRQFFLFLSKSKVLTKVAKKYGLHFGAARFVAGETIEQAISVIKQLNEKGLAVTLDHLGEFVKSEKEAYERTEQAIEAIRAIRRAGVNSQLSLKLTSLGLDISSELVLKNMREILDVAKQEDVFVTIDMEDYGHCQQTLELFKKLKSEYDRVGTVIQAYLYRSASDMEDLHQYFPHLRLVKGAYKESSEVAFPEKKDVDENFKQIIQHQLLRGHYTAIATHDDAILDFTTLIVKENGISTDQFEYQMLYGIRTERQLQLQQEGYTMRIYLPYGTDWYGYFMRRLAERPANVAFVLKGIFR
ncbi:proline dehydrogenase [Bacillus sp. FJAT-50079]|uniref:proline dehydrogenase family protein n=1 Tax=Bacillus sp. FJAT-50079 TaxID=2833577 RepID=UPI001BCA1038|nr:proline dehydrogenase [Bacillus sp. FJAT-50079]MBS4208497.1 proline dehydrogenase [Bacillus sp. FJAT-50079]